MSSAGAQYLATLAPQQQQQSPSAGQQEQDWTQLTQPRFSIRPSLLSPLYTAFRKEQELHAHKQLIMRLMEAHMLLSKDVEGYDSSQVPASLCMHSREESWPGHTSKCPPSFFAGHEDGR
jgi:hypothetical protein